MPDATPEAGGPDPRGVAIELLSGAPQHRRRVALIADVPARHGFVIRHRS